MNKLFIRCFAAWLGCMLGACTATSPSANPQGSQAGDRSGVTVFGTVDAGVGRVK